MKRKLKATQTTARLLLGALAVLCSACSILDPDEPGNLVPKTVMEDSALPSQNINGTRLHLETFGNPSNPVVIFLHGGPGLDYRGLTRLKGLSDDYFLVMFDQRGSGLSQRHDPDEISVEIYCRDLDEIVDYYRGTGTVILLGHSWGCQFAVLYAARHPAKVSRMILIDPGPLTGGDFTTYFKPFFDTDLSQPWVNDWVWGEDFISPDGHARLDYERALGAFNFCPDYHESTTDRMPFWRNGAVAHKTLTEEGIKGNSPSWDFTAGLGAFSGDVLFVRGGLNGVMTDAYMRHVMESYFSHVINTYITIPDAGHDQVWVKAAETQAAIRNFLQ